jgi:hypothetical protein
VFVTIDLYLKEISPFQILRRIRLFISLFLVPFLSLHYNWSIFITLFLPWSSKLSLRRRRFSCISTWKLLQRESDITHSYVTCAVVNRLYFLFMYFFFSSVKSQIYVWSSQRWRKGYIYFTRLVTDLISAGENNVCESDSWLLAFDILTPFML